MLVGRFSLAPMVFVGILFGSSVAAEWRIPENAPLVTRWAKEVGPTHALPEYPRPQMVRKLWQNLNGLWDYAVAAKSEDRRPDSYQGKILVPYAIESALSGVMKAFGPKERLWYHRRITVPQDWRDQRILLHFGAVDFETTVYLNGRELGGHRGGYDAFTFDLTRFLDSGERQDLVVSVIDPSDTSWQLHGKQTLHPGGCSYTATSGIWQTVWMEPVPMTTSIETLYAVPDVENGVLKLTVTGRVGNEPLDLVATAFDEGRQVSTISGKAGFELSPVLRENKVKFYKNTGSWFTTDLVLSMKDARLWSPDSPYLYDLTVEMKTPDGKAVDTIASYFGMRSLATKRDGKGFTRFLLNGKPTLMCGALDQGFWPDGIYTAATDEALRYDVEIAKRAGLDIIRKHVKVEPDRFYYWCDKLGLMVLQDMPTGGEGDPITDLPRSPEASAQCELEKRTLIQQRWNHPSIIAWCPFNEGWGQHDTLRYAIWIKQLDPSRLVDEASGFPWHGGGDIEDHHGGWAEPNPRQIGLVSENGGFGLATPGHNWPCEIWTYHSYDAATGRSMDAMGKGIKGSRLPKLDAKSKAWFTGEVARLYSDLWARKDTSGMTGQFFCQLYDIESECDGLVSYDRAVWKVDPDIIRAAATGGAQAPEKVPFTYRNPLAFSYPYFDGKRERTITELRDPAIIREGDTYYLVYTVFPFTHNTSRDASKPDYNSAPGIMLYSSTDLKSWKFENWLVKSSELPDDCPYKHRFWAAEIHKINGRFYVIFTADNWIKDEYNKGGKIGSYVAFVGVADKVTGPYEHITWLNGAGCDSTLFVDDDGKTYAIMPFGNEYIQQVDLSGIDHGDIRLIGPRKMIISRDNSDVGKKTSPDYLEGPWMMKRAGKYILFTAAPYKTSGDLAPGYWVGAAVADNIWGPYKKQPQVFLGGHIAVFDGPDGKPWFSYRGESGGKPQGRLCIDPIPFAADGSVRPFEPSTERMMVK